MAANSPQTLANHTRLDPAFHLFVLPVSIAAAIWMIVRLVGHPDLNRAALVVLAIAGVVAALKIRLYALKAQDRIIRLEERLRLTKLLSDALCAQAAELTEAQLIALRFASDGELVALVEQTLANRWKNREIKKAIATWRPDYFRI